jgi:glycosyltransferase involved in cell wall biosynthesis
LQYDVATRFLTEVCAMLSIVVPLLNESESLQQLLEEILLVAEGNELSLEVIFVDDGSTDDSWSLIEEFSDAHDEVSGIRFRRNFGKAAALTAGMKAACGDLIMMMDADLQDDPAEIPKFLDRLGEGFDVVNGWKQRRLDPWHKVYPSKVFNWMIGKLTGLRLHDHNCGLKLFRKEVAQELNIYGELHRFIPVIAYSRGFKVTEIPVNHRPREHGHSKYGIRRFLRGFLDLFTVKFLIGFGQRPSHMLGAVGLFFFGLGGLGLAWLTFIWVLMNVFGFLTPEPIGTRPLLAYSIAFTLLGAQAISLGLISELIVSNTMKGEETYSIAERTGQSHR